jgi:hypothetical protein
LGDITYELVDALGVDGQAVIKKVVDLVVAAVAVWPKATATFLAINRIALLPVMTSVGFGMSLLLLASFLLQRARHLVRSEYANSAGD